MLTVDKQKVAITNVGGRGGKEAVLLPLFKESLKRVSAPLYDAISPSGEKLEFKKQANTQWFDLPKYYDLTKEDKKINMIFVLHKDGKVKKIASVKLGDMIDRLLDNPKYADMGWTSEMLESLYRLKKRHPRFQAKVGLDTKPFLIDNKDIVKVIYDAQC